MNLAWLARQDISDGIVLCHGADWFGDVRTAQ
jgi:hypothetical protein